MIKINEVRIGSRVIRKTGDAGSHEITIKSGADIDNCVNYKPIPITPEWLERCGFQKSEKLMFLQVGNQLYIEVDKHLDFYLNPETWRGQFVSPWAKIQYVHQIQNLFFALTGQELEIINA